jgi:hypothetical protein
VVTVSNVNVTSASQITADLQPALSTPTEGATLKVSGAQSATAAVQICARPTISSITPKTWLEGETYSVTIAGTGFTTAAAATAGCPTSTLTATAGRGTVTISSVNVVSAIQLTAKVEAPANVPNETANVTVSATIPPLGIAFIEGCPLPASEATAFQGWSSSTIGTWEQTLSDPSGDSFSGATVEETKAGPGADTCWFPNSAFAAFTDISGGRWPVAANNTWGTDSVGWSADYVAYYRAQGRAPCGFNVQQQMLIQCSADYVNASDYYSDYGTVNILQANITATTVTSSRAGTTETEIH